MPSFPFMLSVPSSPRPFPLELSSRALLASRRRSAPSWPCRALLLAVAVLRTVRHVLRIGQDVRSILRRPAAQTPAAMGLLHRRWRDLPPPQPCPPTTTRTAATARATAQFSARSLPANAACGLDGGARRAGPAAWAADRGPSACWRPAAAALEAAERRRLLTAAALGAVARRLTAAPRRRAPERGGAARPARRSQPRGAQPARASAPGLLCLGAER